MVLINFWLVTLRIIPFCISVDPKVLQALEQEFGKALQQLLSASSGLGIPGLLIYS